VAFYVMSVELASWCLPPLCTMDKNVFILCARGQKGLGWGSLGLNIPPQMESLHFGIKARGGRRIAKSRGCMELCAMNSYLQTWIGHQSLPTWWWVSAAIPGVTMYHIHINQMCSF